jgi:hypothetical protein
MIRFEYDQRSAGMRISWVVKDGAMSTLPIGSLMDLPHTDADGARLVKQDSETLRSLRDALTCCIEAEKKDEQYRWERDRAIIADWKATGRSVDDYLKGLTRCNTPWSKVNLIEGVLKGIK